MSEKWTPKVLNVEDINGGNRYSEGMITVEDYNKVIEGVMQASADSESAETVANSANEKSQSAETAANLANENSQLAVTQSNEAKQKAESAEETSSLANETASEALLKIEGLEAESVEDGDLLYAEIVKTAEGKLKLILHNTKGDKGDGAIPVYDKLGNNTDGAINQKVVSENLNSLQSSVDSAILDTDEINLNGGNA